jgi:predicted Fe-Mo cluster-binding NifX family protein
MTPPSLKAEYEEILMAWRIAVTSADKVLINQHFGHAGGFYIYDLEGDGKASLVDYRATPRSCGSGGDHGSVVWEEIADALRDCSALITAKIGPTPRKRLELAGLSVFEEPAVIEEALNKLAIYYTRIKKEQYG